MASRVNGPGLRAVVWFQGCTIGCAGCFNPETHDPGLGHADDVESLFGRIAALTGVEGVSISGGEPFQQPEALLELLTLLRTTPLSTLVFSGLTMEAIRARPLGSRILSGIDVLVAGPYVRDRRLGTGLLGSSNQRLHLLTGRYRPGDFARLPNCEVIIHGDGSITVSGFRQIFAARRR